MDSFLSSWWCNPTLEQLQPGLDHTYNAGYINSQTFSNRKLPTKTLTESPTTLFFNVPQKDAWGWFEFRLYMFWVSFVLGSNLTFLCFLDKIMDNNELKQRNKIQFEPRIKLRYNIKLVSTYPAAGNCFQKTRYPAVRNFDQFSRNGSFNSSKNIRYLFRNVKRL